MPHPPVRIPGETTFAYYYAPAGDLYDLPCWYLSIDNVTYDVTGTVGPELDETGAQLPTYYADVELGDSSVAFSGLPTLDDAILAAVKWINEQTSGC